MYSTWDNPFPVDRAWCIKNMKELWFRKKFIRVVRNPQIIAFIIGDMTAWAHAKERCFSQSYYCSNVHGIVAYRCMEILHKEMEIEARRLKSQFVMSSGRFDDTRCVFSRILEKLGWERYGILALKKLT
jgi:hypothetical protein